MKFYLRLSKKNANSVFISELIAALLFALGLIAVTVLFAQTVDANPTGGSVVAGSGAISGGAGLETITQSSQNAIINWQSFSIGVGETTNFLVPNATSATLNRVTGGNLSEIYGTLSSNGKILLINPNGILFGSSGMINTAGFTASTLNVSNKQFMSNRTLHFMGDSKGAVVNLGTVTTDGGGSVTFIGKTVINTGSIKASGNVNLAATSDIFITGADMNGVTVRLADAQGKTIKATDKAAVAAAMQHVKMTGNPFSLAVNTGGAAEATSAFRIGGHTFLGNKGSSFYHKMLAEYGGSAVNTGTIAAQNVSLQSQARNVTNTGTINAATSASLLAMKGTLTNTGTITTAPSGTIETSGLTVDIAGVVDAGFGGKWLIDPTDLTVDSTNVGTYLLSLQDGTAVTIQADNSITINAAMSWSTTADLTINSGGSIAINAAISAPTGSLVLVAGTTITDTAALNVGTFTLQGGNWVQNTSSLPAFSASNFVLSGGTFLRVLGGDGSDTPYQLTDVYGLQGVGGFLSSNFALANDIDASGTSGWNGGAGFVPIGMKAPNTYDGTFEGQSHTISGLTINDPTNIYSTGLFVAISGTVRELYLTALSVIGAEQTGGLAGYLSETGDIFDVTVSGSVSGTDRVGGLIGANVTGYIDTASSTGTVSGHSDVGGLVGMNTFSGIIAESYSSSTVTGTGTDAGGLVGDDAGGSIYYAYAIGNVSGAANVGGLAGEGGGGGTIEDTYAAGHVTGTSNVAGLVGANDSSTVTALDSFYDTTTTGQSEAIAFDFSTGSTVTGLATPPLQAEDTFMGAGWDFTQYTGTWQISPSVNGGMPTLQAFTPTLVLTALNQTVEYGQAINTVAINGTTYSVLGLRGGDAVTDILNGGVALGLSGSNVDAGTFNTITIGGTLQTGSRYSIVTVDGTEIITQAPLYISIGAGTSVAGTTPDLSQVPEYSFGLVGSDTLAGLGLTLSTTANASSPVGTYDISGSIGANPNYAVTIFDGELFVTAAPLPPVAPPTPPSIQVQAPVPTAPIIYRVPYEAPEWPNVLPPHGWTITWIGRKNGPIHFLHPEVVKIPAATTVEEVTAKVATAVITPKIAPRSPKGPQGDAMAEILALLILIATYLAWRNRQRLGRLLSVLALAASLLLGGCASTTGAWESEHTFVHRPGSENEVVVGPGTYHVAKKTGKLVTDSNQPAKVPWWTTWNGGVIDSDPMNPGKLVGVQ